MTAAGRADRVPIASRESRPGLAARRVATVTRFLFQEALPCWLQRGSKRLTRLTWGGSCIESAPVLVYSAREDCANRGNCLFSAHPRPIPCRSRDGANRFWPGPRGKSLKDRDSLKDGTLGPGQLRNPWRNWKSSQKLRCDRPRAGGLYPRAASVLGGNPQRMASLQGRAQAGTGVG